jgi:hypothetical protein
MGIVEYRESIGLSSHSFYALIMAAMRQADDSNLSKLKAAFPKVHQELLQRYNAPGGALDKPELDYVTASLEPRDTSDEEEDDDDGDEDNYD